jgi:hypothetical protein
LGSCFEIVMVSLLHGALSQKIKIRGMNAISCMGSD